MRGMPYGTHATAPLAIGSPFAAASASAFRFASNGPAYCGFNTSGVAAGAASFGSAPRPPRYVAHTPVRSTCADAVVAIEAIAIATAALSLTPLALVISLLPSHRAVGQHAAVRHRDARQERARLSALERADDGHHFVAELEILELPSGLLEAVVAKTDGVPLFVEELTTMLVESGQIRRRGDQYELAGPLPTLQIPSTLACGDSAGRNDGEQ